MKITKLEHACLIVEKSGHRLVIDPGAYTTPMDVRNVDAIVITHEHADHWTPEQLRRVLDFSPDAPVYGPEGVAAAAGEIPVSVVHAGDAVTAGVFELRFFGGKHAVIHSSVPVVDNVGVLVDDTLYYPGDSYAIPEGVDVEVLATPSSAPWLKIGEVMDFVAAISPRHSFPTHEMINSELGKQMANARIGAVTESGGGEHHPLVPGDVLEI